VKSISHRQKRIMTERVLDDFRVRMRHSRELRQLDSRKQRLALVMALISFVSLIVAVIGVQARLVGSTTTPCNVCKTINVVLTVVLLVLSATRYLAHRQLMKRCMSEMNGFSIILYPVVEMILLLVGVVPPFVEVIVSSAVVGSLDSSEFTQDPGMHIDVLGVLMLMARIPLMFNWFISVFVISSPIYLAWQYNVQVSPLFRIKYLFTQKPFTMVTATISSSWAAGAFIVYAVEHAFTPSFTLWFFTAGDLLSGMGWGSALPYTFIGRVVSIILETAGLLSVAVLTATFCSSSELDATEVWLISTIERQHSSTATIRHSTRFIQRAFRSLKKRGSYDRKTIAAGRDFKRYRLNQTATQVSNIKVLHGEVLNLQTQQKELVESAKRTEALLQRVLEGQDGI
jgi:uncharacterized membrane protein (DUF485 family)